MAATAISLAAAKGNILVSMTAGGARRFGSTIQSINNNNNYATFRLIPHFNNNKKTTLLKPNRAGKPSFCTAQPQEPAVAAAAEAKPQMPVKEAAALLDIRVGRVVRAWRHEEAESLYVEEVDVGEGEPRVICSGLVAHVPLDRLQGLAVVVLANLKPRNMRGVRSSGMLLAASDGSRTTVELLSPPEGSAPGHRVWFGVSAAVDDQTGEPLALPPPGTPNFIQKKKIWELVQPRLGVDGSGVAVLEGCHVMMAPAGPVRAPSLKNANIS